MRIVIVFSGLCVQKRRVAGMAGSETDQWLWRRQLGQLYSEHQGWLHNWLRRRLGCRHRADDLTQDTFVRLLARRDGGEVVQEPRAFLATVARRVLLNHWRREDIERAYLEALSNLPPEQMPGTEEQVVLLETLFEIDRLLDGLPRVVKQAFLHARLDGLSHGEIAAELGVSVSTVKRYLVRAGTRCFFADATE